MIDFDAIANRIFEAAVEQLGVGAVVVETRAKARAPVRRLFHDGGYSIRLKKMAEINETREARDYVLRTGSPKATVVQPDDVPTIWGRTITGKRPPRHWHERRLGKAQRLLAQYDAEMASRKAGNAPQMTMLTRRGASEVRSMRAAFSTWGHTHIGGRLRGEIAATAPTVTGRRAEAWVISPTPYAKYQEFGTRHNAAHPFLRPAAEESREDIVSRIAAAVREASRTGGSHMDIEIVVRL